MSTPEGLLAATLAFSRAIERDGHLRSALRRAATALDAVGHEQVEEFANALKRIPELAWIDEAVADGCTILIAQRNVLRYKKIEDERVPPKACDLLARRLGEKVGERRRLSELRFQRLLRAADSDDRLQQMRRAIALLDTGIHPLAVVHAWLDLHSDKGRRRFARAYFTGIPAPDAEPEAATAEPA